MDFLEIIKSGILAIKKIGNNQEINKICDHIMGILRLKDYPKYLDRVILQDVHIEHLQNQCNFLKNLQKINDRDQVFNILLKNEEETYRLNRCVQELYSQVKGFIQFSDQIYDDQLSTIIQKN